MPDKPLLTERQLQTLLESGPELDKIEPLLSPELRGVLVDLQRNAATAYAAGDWQVQATGETITVPEVSPRKKGNLVENAQAALGNAYLGITDQSKTILKSIMDNLGLNPSAPRASAQNKGKA